MKKLVTLIILGVIAYFGYTHFDEIKEKATSEFFGLFSGFQKDYEKKTNLARSGYDEISVQSEIDRLKKQKSYEIGLINKQIAQRDNQLKQIMMNNELSFSDKKAKTEQIQKNIDKLKAQRQDVEEKYRKLIKETRE